MQKINGKLIYSPTDLSSWSKSPYAAWMARFAVEHPKDAPEKDEPDDMLKRLATKGLTHEDKLETTFRSSGKSVVNIESELKDTSFSSHADRRKAAWDLTLKLLHAGTDVIAQATLERGPFRGHADFLIKVQGTSDLGDFHYEVWDTKLARRVKPEMVLQLCCYVDMLEEIQGCKAGDIVVALGNGTHERVPLVDCFDYYRAIKSAFLADQTTWSADAEPDPAEYADHGNWSGYAATLLEERDHLSRVARITRRQIERLETAGISTMTALAAMEKQSIPGIEPEKLQWLVRQAALQCKSASQNIPAFRVLEQQPDASTGLATLPAASANDVFFDIEGYPLEGDGLEYLWGCTYLDQTGERTFRDWWAHDTDAERIAFEGFIDWVYERWRADPAMHIYHYAPYETTACKRLMGTHGSREHELDELLRNDVFIDLYAIVIHGVQIGEPRYSIKNVEHLYRSKRDTDVASGGDSVVVYDLWREAYLQGEENGDWEKSEILAGLRDYNKDDCDSTLELCEWLRVQRGDAQEQPETAAIEAKETELSELIIARHELRDRLLDKATNAAITEKERTLLKTLAGVLEFHRREEKNAWWRYFDRMDLSNMALADDPACLDNCTRTERDGFKPKPRARNLAWEYRFDSAQEFKGIGGEVHLKGSEDENGRALKANVLKEFSDLEGGRVVLQCRVEPPEQISLVPNEIVRADPIPAAIDAVVRDIENGQTERSALLDFLERRPPRILGNADGRIVQSPASMLEDTVNTVLNLDNSCLIIQGPPGAGKSYTGAHIIAAMVEAGKTVGIASNSHSAINNLLLGAARECRNREVETRFICTKDTSDALQSLGVMILNNADLANELSTGCVVGTTAWGFSRDDLAGKFDVLIVDEAGQVSVANLISMSRAASNIVVMGDQRQLGQPTQGTHPAESGLSVLDYRLGDTAAVDPAHGVFLGTTYRLHPAVNAPISRHVYADQLRTADVTSLRTLVPRGDNSPLDHKAGVVYLPVAHEGNQQASDEEVNAIVAAVGRLTGRTLNLKDGGTRKVTIEDMLFVAPYNAQVTRLKNALGEHARVGSVDRFQGQEAPIVFLSMCSSDATASPRGLGFLFDRNRLNVAVSRAETLCVIVGHPRLSITPVATLDNLKRVNFVAALMGGSC